VLKEDMLKKLLLITIAVTVLLVGGGCPPYAEPDIRVIVSGPPPPPGHPPPYHFEPDEYTVSVNSSVVLRIHNPDKVPYMFIINGLNVKKELYPGRITPVHFTARQIGRYEFYIEGLREKGLVGTLIVR
jgi:hypothetical protein